MATRKVPALDGAGKINEKHIPDRLSDGALSAAIEKSASSWIDSRGIDVSSKPPADDTPVIAWSEAPATELTSPVVYKPSICGKGSQVLNWDGRDDPNIRYFSGVYQTFNGANADMTLVGSTKPGGTSQAATWPLVFAFNTYAAAIELYIYSARAAHSMMVEVNGRMVSDTLYRQPGDQVAVWCRVKINFPSKAYGSPRQIRIWADGAFGLAEIRVPSGETITKPTATVGRRAGIIADSFVNGAGASNSWPNQGTSNLETFAPRLLRMMGASDMVLAGIGGTGFVSGGDTSSYKTRVAAVVATAPDVLFFLASVNDGSAAGTIQSEVEATLALAASVPKVYVIGTLLSGYADNRAAVKAGTLAAGRTFIDLGAFLTGTGNIGLPKGDGNRDYLLMTDNVHPTLDAHRAIARKLFVALNA